ncbi:hypothetical protein PTKIN_Ptkin02bG0168300 [Pterospermum kingtungense]
MGWLLRNPEDADGFVIYGKSFRGQGSELLVHEVASDYFTIAMTHGGYLNRGRHGLEYIEGEVDFFDFCEVDRMSYIELYAMAGELGHQGGITFYWLKSDPHVPSVFKLISCDVDVIEMCSSLLPTRYVSVFFSYETVAEVGSHLQSIVVIEELHEDQVCQNEKRGENSSTSLDIVLYNRNKGSKRILENDRETRNDKETRTESFLVDDEDGAHIPRGSMEHDNRMDNEETIFDDCDFRDNDYEFDDDDDIMFEKSVHPDEEVGIEHIRGSSNGGQGVRVEDTVEVDSDVEDNSVGVSLSDDIYNIEGYDNEAVNQPVKRTKKKWPKFNVVSSMNDPIFCVGMLFTSKQQLRDAIKNAVIKDSDSTLCPASDRVNIQLKKNDKIRLRAVCNASCKWLLYARKFNDDEKDTTFQIRTYNSVHTCCKEYDNRNMDYKWLAEKYLNQFLVDLSLSLASFDNLVQKDYVIQVQGLNCGGQNSWL